MRLKLSLIFVTLLAACLPVSAQVFKIGQPPLKGSFVFDVKSSYDRTYQRVLDWLMQRGYAISTWDPEAGQLVTLMAVTTARSPSGEISQTGNRLILTFLRNGADLTTVKVMVTEQHRGKYGPQERNFTKWSPARANDPESQRIAKDIEAVVQ